MRLPLQARPILRHASGSVTRTRHIQPLHCSVIDSIKCGVSGAALVAGPCDPVGFPEDLPACVAAAVGYFDKCHDCLAHAAKKAICFAVQEAGKAHIPIPPQLQALCS